MSQPTDGDWRAVDRNVFAGDVCIATASYPRNVRGLSPSAYDQAIINAAFIAEGPRLVAAMRKIQQLIMSCQVDDASMLNQIDAIISNALRPVTYQESHGSPSV